MGAHYTNFDRENCPRATQRKMTLANPNWRSRIPKRQVRHLTSWRAGPCHQRDLRNSHSKLAPSSSGGFPIAEESFPAKSSRIQLFFFLLAFTHPNLIAFFLLRFRKLHPNIREGKLFRKFPSGELLLSKQNFFDNCDYFNWRVTFIKVNWQSMR